MTEYHKLVRDKIPELIRYQGQTPCYRVLADGEYTRCLKDKLSEEVAEFLRDQTSEELADILEVVLRPGGGLGVFSGRIGKNPPGKSGKTWRFPGENLPYRKRRLTLRTNRHIIDP